MTRKLYDISFSQGDQLTTWQRWATDKQEARTLATKALEQEYPETEIVAVEETFQRFGAVVGTQDYLCLEML